MKSFIFRSILFSLIVSFIYCQNEYCTEFPSQLGSDPIPELPKSYEVRIETNLELDGRTQEMRLFYDYDQRRAAIELKEDNQYYKLIFNYETDEIFELNSPIRSDIYANVTPPNDLPLVYTECKAFPLKNTQGLNQYFSFSVVNGLLYPGPPSQPFQFKPQVYEGEDTVRGIPCDVYKACLRDQDTTTNILIRHYFSKSSFSLAGSNNFFKRLPIKAVIEGALPPPDDGGQPIKFKRTVNYYDFRQDISFRPDTFITPSGVYCDQRKPTKDIPKKGSMFGYSQEIVSVDGVQYLKNVYVANDFLRFEIKNSQYQEATFNTLEPITFINDYSLGLQYAINNVRGNCSLRPIVTDIFNQTYQTYNSVIDFAAQLQSTSNIFRPNSSYIFTGSKDSNGIKSDRFISKTSKGIFEYTISDSRFTIDNEDEPEKDVPVALYIENNQINISSYSSFYNFDTSIPKLELFDVGNCFQPAEKIDFTLVFNYKGIVTKPQLDEQKDLKNALLAQLYSQTQESSLRFSPPKIFVSNDGNIYAQVTIYPNPPPLKLFVYIESLFLVVPSFNTSRNISSTEECARICLGYLRCLSFDYNPSAKSCHLNENHVTDGSLVFQGDYFDHYSRNTDVPRLSRESFQLYSIIENLIRDKKLVLDINVIQDKSVETQTVRLVASKILKESFFDRFGTIEYLSRFRNVLPKSSFTNSKDKEYSGITIDDCARNCIDQIGAECKSFDYCYITGECRLSHDPAPSRENTTEYMSEEYCDIYEKDALIHYDRFPARTEIDPKDILYTDIKSPNDCAVKCDNELKINCRSFNYCRNKSECYLSERHSPDIVSSSSTTNNLTCGHYSKRHISDFVYTSSANITLSAEIVLKDLSLERCSSACVGANGFNCKSFDYCPESRTCLLNSGQVAIDTIPSTSEKERDICGHYRREYFFATSQNVNLRNKNSDNSGLLIGLSIAFAVLSVSVGVIGTIYLFNKKRLK